MTVSTEKRRKLTTESEEQTMKVRTEKRRKLKTESEGQTNDCEHRKVKDR